MTTRLSPRCALALLVDARSPSSRRLRRQAGGAGPKAPQVPALRFAGVDLEYALDRIATEAGGCSRLDEIMPKDQSPDLSLVRVDLDLPAGPLDDAMRLLREKVGGFDFQIYPACSTCGATCCRPEDLARRAAPGGRPLRGRPGRARQDDHGSSTRRATSTCSTSRGTPAGGVVKLDIPDEVVGEGRADPVRGAPRSPAG